MDSYYIDDYPCNKPTARKEIIKGKTYDITTAQSPDGFAVEQQVISTARLGSFTRKKTESFSFRGLEDLCQITCISVKTEVMEGVSALLPFP